MAKLHGKLSLILFAVFIPLLGYSTLITSISDGNWHSASTWDSGTIPTSTDSVIINGHEVEITTTDASAAYLKIVNNASALNTALLDINGDVTVNILGDLVATANNINQSLTVSIRSSSIVNVSGGLYFTRSNDNNSDNNLSLKVYDTAQLIVSEDLQFDYKNSGGLEISHDIEIYNDAYVYISNASTLSQGSGAGFTMTVYGQADVVFNDSLTVDMQGGTVMNVSIDGSATMTVQEELIMNTSGGSNDMYLKLTNGASTTVNGNTLLSSTTAGNGVEVRVHGSGASILDLNGDITMAAIQQGDVALDINSSSKVYLTGNLYRPTNFGSISMENSSGFYFDGTSTQILPSTNLGGSGTDNLEFTNIYLNNTSAGGFTMGGALTVTEYLDLNDGILHTNNDSILILDNGATIDVGSSTSYVDGPIIKRGTSVGRFTFPTGNNGIYAPVQIDQISNPTLEYTVEFIGCPPPIGAVTDPLKLVNQSGYWIISRSDAAAVGNIDLYWDDANARGVTDLASLVVSYYNPLTGWFSLGQSNLSGGVGVAVSGSVRNDLGCPPPIGVSLFAIGSTQEKENALPVELTDFRAFKNNDNSIIFLEWETASEENSDHFVVEKSLDGISFSPIATVPANRNTTTVSYYDARDNNPVKGNNYYRIMQVDQDQLMSFSKLVNVFINGQEDTPIVYPNPVREQISVFSKTLENEKVSIKILDSNGQIVYQGQHRAQDGQILLSPTSLNIKKQGLYYLNYEIGGSTHSLSFFKVISR